MCCPPAVQTWMVASWAYPATNLPHGLAASLQGAPKSGGKRVGKELRLLQLQTGAMTNRANRRKPEAT
jgi:hypothetical protein